MYIVQCLIIGFATLKPNVVQYNFFIDSCTIFNNWVCNLKNKCCTTYLPSLQQILLLEQISYNIHKVLLGVQCLIIGFATLRLNVVQYTLLIDSCTIFNNWVCNLKTKCCTTYLQSLQQIPLLEQILYNIHKVLLAVQCLIIGFATLRPNIVQYTIVIELYNI